MDVSTVQHQGKYYMVSAGKKKGEFIIIVYKPLFNNKKYVEDILIVKAKNTDEVERLITTGEIYDSVVPVILDRAKKEGNL